MNTNASGCLISMWSCDLGEHMLFALHHLEMFAGVQSWSGYFLNSAHYSPVLAGETPAQLAANSPLDFTPRLAPSIRRFGLHAFLYAGGSDPEIGRRELHPFATEFARAGAQVGAAIYPGGHDWALWRAQTPHMLQLANAWFGRAHRTARCPAHPGMDVSGVVRCG